MAVDLDLVEEGQDPSFKILLKRTESIVVHPGAHLQIPIAFSPLVHTEHIGELQVAYDPGESDEDVLIWRYPIHGQAEVPHMGTLFRITGKARIPIDEEIHLQLPGVGRIEKEEHFTPHLEIAGDVGGALASAIKIVPVVATLRQPTDRLVYRVQLLPQAAVSKAVNVILQKSTGGRWRFDIRLDVAPPDVVDTIEVEATVGTVGVAPIWLFSPSAAEETPFLGEWRGDAAYVSGGDSQGWKPCAMPFTPAHIALRVQRVGEGHAGECLAATETSCCPFPSQPCCPTTLQRSCPWSPRKGCSRCTPPALTRRYARPARLPSASPSRRSCTGPRRPASWSSRPARTSTRTRSLGSWRWQRRGARGSSRPSKRVSRTSRPPSRPVCRRTTRPCGRSLPGSPR